MLDFDLQRNQKAGFDPDNITTLSTGSNKMVHWTSRNYPKGPPHLFVAHPSNQITLNSGYPYCATRKPCICNSLQLLCPALAAVYDIARSGVGPERVLRRSMKMAC